MKNKRGIGGAGVVAILLLPGFGLGFRSGAVRSTGFAVAQAPLRHVKARLAEVTTARLSHAYGQLPLSFEANQGQIDHQVKFVCRGSGYTLFLTRTEAVLALTKPQAQADPEDLRQALPFPDQEVPGSVLHVRLVGANAAPEVNGLEELPGRSNYFIGNDPEKWRTNIPTFAKVKYHAVYPGVDLVYYGNQHQLEYDFVVSPGGNPNGIELEVRGAGEMTLDAQGDLVLKTQGGEVRLNRPQIYQSVNGSRRKIPGHYVIRRDHQVGFELARYDTAQPVVIDPTLSYSSYLGGSGDRFGGGEQGNGIAVDSAGNAYVAGITPSTNFPTNNALQPAFGGGSSDAFVAKVNADGSALIFSTYLGGGGFDQVNGIAVDASGNAYLTGATNSSNFPTRNAFQGALRSTSGNAFVTKLTPDGSAIIQSTYLGGTGSDIGQGIAVDSAGSAYVAGMTLSTNFPTMNPLQPNSGGGQDAFITRLTPDGSRLVYSTYLGGNGFDAAAGIAVDSAGSAYVTGKTLSRNFPTVNPLQPTLRGFANAFVAKLGPDGSALAYSTYLGGSRNVSPGDQSTGIAVDSAGSAYVTGTTVSTDFPTVNALQPAFAGGVNDAFVSKFSSDGSTLIYSTYLGGSSRDQAFGIAVDSAGNAYVTGDTNSTDFPTVNPFQPTLGNPVGNAFVAELMSDGSALVYSSYLGGTTPFNRLDRGVGIAVDLKGGAYVTGFTSTTDFPTVNPFQPALGGANPNAFVAKVSGGNPPGVTLFPSSLSFADQAVGTTSAPQTVTLTNTGSETLNIAGIVLAGSVPGDYAFDDATTCPLTGGTVAAGGNCVMSVTFTPSDVGTRSAQIGITDDAPGSPRTVPLTGTGTPAVPVARVTPASRLWQPSGGPTPGLSTRARLSDAPIDAPIGRAQRRCPVATRLLSD